jgi:hypothetical protein
MTGHEKQPKPKPRPPKPKPPDPVKDEPGTEVQPTQPTRPKRPKRRRKPQAVSTGFQVDWYWVAIAVLSLFTILPYVAPFLKDRDTKPNEIVDNFDSLGGNVSTWFETVASDDPKRDVPKYVEALRATASAEISNVAKIDEQLKTEVESRLGRVGWLNWGLFNVELLKEVRRLRDAGKLSTVKQHQAFLNAVADALQKVGG